MTVMEWRNCGADITTGASLKTQKMDAKTLLIRKVHHVNHIRVPIKPLSRLLTALSSIANYAVGSSLPSSQLSLQSLLSNKAQDSIGHASSGRLLHVGQSSPISLMLISHTNSTWLTVLASPCQLLHWNRFLLDTKKSVSTDRWISLRCTEAFQVRILMMPGIGSLIVRKTAAFAFPMVFYRQVQSRAVERDLLIPSRTCN